MHCLDGMVVHGTAANKQQCMVSRAVLQELCSYKWHWSKPECRLTQDLLFASPEMLLLHPSVSLSDLRGMDDCIYGSLCMT